MTRLTSDEVLRAFLEKDIEKRMKILCPDGPLDFPPEITVEDLARQLLEARATLRDLLSYANDLFCEGKIPFAGLRVFDQKRCVVRSRACLPEHAEPERDEEDDRIGGPTDG